MYLRECGTDRTTHVQSTIVENAKGRSCFRFGPTCLDGDQARGAGVKLRPVVGEPREVFLGDDIVITRRRRVETVEDDSDEQVHEYVRDRQREAFIRVARGGLAEAKEGRAYL